MRCHYDVLGLTLTANNDEIKKAYRKSALQWHPDKHSNSDKKIQEEANKKFLEIQDAYETLSDTNDRAWYDSHREVLINGGNPGEPGEGNYMFNIYPYFSPTCYKGFGDDDRGFYSIYRDMFATLAEEDRQFYDEEINIPDFGESGSNYDEIVGPFYSFWLSYCTPRSFVWCEKHDTREAGDRYVRRIMEKENKKLIDKAKKERNEEIRKIVETVRKRDKRVIEYKRIQEEKILAAQKKAQEKRDAERLKKLENMKEYVEPEWSNLGKKLTKLQLEGTDSEADEEIDSDDDFDEDLYCIACDKSFKKEKALRNHENSKKHKENIELLKKHLQDEDEEMRSDKHSDESMEKEESFEKEENQVKEEDNEEEEVEENIVKASKLSKKQKKKQKKNKQMILENLQNEESDSEPEDSREDNIVIDQDLKQTIEPESKEETKPTSEAKKTPNKSKKNKKDKKTPNAEAEDLPIELKCTVCLLEFETRNKLFDHINAEGHVSVPTLSYNQIKKNRILLAKSNKNKKK